MTTYRCSNCERAFEGDPRRFCPCPKCGCTVLWKVLLPKPPAQKARSHDR